jgi:hypothetical protein
MWRIANHRWSFWVRGIVYGATCALAAVVMVALVFAAARDELPFNHYKGASEQSISVARRVAAPIAVPGGAIVGFVLAEYIWRSRLSYPQARQFSLRELMLAVTILGLSLGLVVWFNSNRPLSPGATHALNAARQWLTSQRLDPASYEFTVDADGTGWTVLVEYQPPTPGGHTLLRIDSQGKVVEVIPGR